MLNLRSIFGFWVELKFAQKDKKQVSRFPLFSDFALVFYLNLVFYLKKIFL